MNFELLTLLRNERNRDLLREAERERLRRSLREQQKQPGARRGVAHYWTLLKARIKGTSPLPRDGEARSEKIEIH